MITLGVGGSKLSSEGKKDKDSGLPSNEGKGAAPEGFSIPPDDLIFGDDKGGDSVSIKPITPKEERKSGTGWSFDAKKAGQDSASTAGSGAPTPPPGLFGPPQTPLAPAAPQQSQAPGGAPPPPPPPPSFNWAAPAAPPPPPAPPKPDGKPGLVLPALDDDMPPPPGLPPFLAGPPLPANPNATAGGAYPEESHADSDQPGQRKPLSTRPPARGKIQTDLPLAPTDWSGRAQSASEQGSKPPLQPPNFAAGAPQSQSAHPPFPAPAAPEPQPLPPAPEPVKAPPVEVPQPARAPQPPASGRPSPPQSMQRPSPSSPAMRPPGQGQGQGQGPQRPRPSAAPLGGEALPKPKAFGQLMPKKEPQQPQRPSTPGAEPRLSAPHSTPASAPKNSVFTVIGDKDVSPKPPASQEKPPRIPFPDDSLPVMQKVEEPLPTWQNSPPVEHVGTSVSEPVSQLSPAPDESFDNLPSDEWSLDDDEREPLSHDLSSSPFAPASPTQPPEQAPYAIPQDEPRPSLFSQPDAPPEPDGFEQNDTDYASSTNDLGMSQSGQFTSDNQEEQSTSYPTSLAGYESQSESRPVPDSKQFREACLASSTADSAMGNDNFKIALPLFKKAHKLFKKAAATDSQEFGNCLHKLADCYYHQEEHQEALNYYNEFMEWSRKRSSRPDVLAVVVGLKRARTFQKLDRMDECDQAFADTVDMANRALPVSHPMFSVVYKSYIAMLQFNGGASDRISQLESQFSQKMATASRTIQVPQDLQDELSAWTDVEKADIEKAERNRQLRLSRQMFQNERSRPGDLVHKVQSSSAVKTTIIVVVALLLIGSLALMIFGAITLLDQDQSGEKGADSAKPLIDSALKELVGVTFKSADGLKSVVLKKDGTISMTFGNDSVSTQTQTGSPKEGIIEDFRHMMFGKTNYVIEQVGDALKDPDGTMLYRDDSKDSKIIKEMDRIADLAGYYYSRNQNRYPSKRKDFTEMGPDVRLENPIGQSMKPVIKVHEFEKYEGDVAFSETLAKFKDGKKLFDQDTGAGTPPGLIECLSTMPFDQYHSEDGIAIMIRAYDSRGKLITSSVPGETYVICQKNGVKYIVTKPEAVKSPIKESSKTTTFLKVQPPRPQ